jgi:hypothetical protein
MRRSTVYDKVCRFPQRCAFDMAKKYEEIRVKIPLPGGGFAEAFRMAIIEFSCLGERRFDIGGYPYESEEHAFAGDWDRLALDLEAAVDDLDKEIAGNAGSAERLKRPATD